MRDCPQDALWHAEGDVWTHTQMVIEALQSLEGYQQATPLQRALLSIAALLHDVAKPECTETDELGRIVSPRHAKVGEQLARRLLWDVDFASRETICALVRLHGLPLWSLQRENPESAVAAASLRLDTALLHALTQADILGRICEDPDDLIERNAFFRELCLEQECWAQPKAFANAHSRFHYFFKNDRYPAERFDDTQFEITVLSGIAGSGKDTYAERLDLPMVSLDALRKELKIHATDRDGQGKVAQLAYERAKEYCRRKQSFVWNSTNLTRELRTKLVDTLSVYNPYFRMVYIETSWENILARRREEMPVSVLEKMWRILEMPLPTEAHEVVYRRG